ncbi:cytochrome biogenesis protein [Vibrio navarrensis]|uniref:sulfite exporter TauE/SafE family protein n=1 Tax=Vibrio navarrensis TaxID=29495 RepID=UPI00192FA815|nr:sulfite exporter TauE/SafE family protein [Vibrio navarrensis]MBE3667794.1 cytochrome biogenesis protein [Vibrio navarrensis]
MNGDYLGALMIGLAGAGHCLGMCGGIASLLNLGSQNPSPKLNTLFYNLGRLLSYGLFGAIVGGTISSLSDIAGLNQSLAWLRLLAALFMILVALYIAKWWNGLLFVEKLGQLLWRFIKPMTQHFMPIRHPLQAIPFGFLWGWLPCGLVYSALTWSALSGSALNGALMMLAFGLGTLPAMLLVGIGAEYFARIQKSSIFRHTSATILVLYGLYTGFGAATMLGLAR